jgi:hypothetical protein
MTVPREWKPGKDAVGSDTFTSDDLIITRHKIAGVQLWRGTGMDRVLVSLGFTSVEGAKRYVEDRL